VDDGAGHGLEEMLDSHCREQLAGFKRPKRYILVDSLPKNPTGKIAKGTLRDTYAGG
jgi:acyl-coenzyme A synthetase/AMP-(fatty) acid ligase